MDEDDIDGKGVVDDKQGDDNIAVLTSALQVLHSLKKLHHTSVYLLQPLDAASRWYPWKKFKRLGTLLADEQSLQDTFKVGLSLTTGLSLMGFFIAAVAFMQELCFDTR